MLTYEQQEAVDTASNLNSREILKIEACAGSGKTSTLVQIAQANPKSRFLYLAFNRAIVDEAKKSFPPNVRVYTTHGLAYYWYAYTYGDERLSNIRTDLNIFDIKPLFPTLDDHELFKALVKFKEFCYNNKKSSDDDKVNELFEAIHLGKLPLTHDFYLKSYALNYKSKFRNYEYVLLDEAQDTNDVTLDIFKDNNCRQVLVGDRHQAIYAFRGAVNALSKIKGDKTINLSSSFRSTQKILDRANYFLKVYSKDQNIDMTSKLSGICKSKTKALITRTNFGIIDKLISLEDCELKSYKLTRPSDSIFACALSVLSLKKGSKSKVHPQYKWLKRFKSFESLKAYAKKCDDPEISASISLVDNYGDKLYNTYKRACSLNNNLTAPNTITTAHSAKGLEWDDVILSNDFPQLDKISSRSSYSLEQELNLYYVAITRAKYNLLDLTLNSKEYAKYKKLIEH